MKSLTLIFIFLLSFSKQIYADTTEVFIIGTVHYETENFNPDSLYNIFTIINPDVILMESDASYMTEDFKLVPGYEDIANETKAITMYLTENTPALRPYDLENRDQFLFSTTRRRTERNFFNDLSDLYDEGKLTEIAIKLTGEILENMGNTQSMTLSTPFEINKEESREKIDKINYYDFEAVSEIIKETPALSSYESYWKDVIDFWIVRNNAMVENIKKYIDEFPNKRIVVLCGFAHKPYLINGLQEITKDGRIKIKNYWED